MAAIFHGRFADAEREMLLARELGAKARDPNVSRADVMQRFASLRLQGRHSELIGLCSELQQSYHGLEHADLLVRLQAAEAWLLAEEPSRAAGLLSRADTARILSLCDLSTTGPLIRWFEAVGEVEQCAVARATLEQRESRFAFGGMTLMIWDEPVASLLGRCARHEGRFADAEKLFQEAVELSERAGSPPYAAWARLELAELLLDRTPSTQAPRAHELLRQASETAERLGMPGLERRTRRALTRCSAHATDLEQPDSRPLVAPAPLVASKATLPRLARDGETWTLSDGVREIRLKDSRGVQWLQMLLERPEEELHVLDLVSPGQHDRGDGGELLDARAVAQYRARLGELAEELGEAESFNDLGRAAALGQERDFLQRELSRALGLGGRERRAGAAAERARINVQRRLRDVLSRIAAQAPDLGQRLERSITTGVFCRYRP